MRNKKKIFFNIACALAAFGAALLFSEFFLRALRPEILGKANERDKFCKYDPWLGWVNEPGARGRLIRKDFDISVQINSKGLRGKEHDYKKPAGKKRIVVLGDSFTWGYGVDASERFTELLESKLPGTEVINMGVSGYGTDQEYLYFLKEGIRYEPDVLILMLHVFTDLSDNLTNYQYDYFKPLLARKGDELIVTNVPVPRDPFAIKMDKWMMGRSALWNFFGDRELGGKKLHYQWAERVNQLTGSRLAKIEKNAEVAPALTCLISEGLHRAAAKLSVPLVVVLIPHLEPGRINIRRLLGYDELRECLSAHEIKTLDLKPFFEENLKNHPEEPLVFSSDPHWNAKGHALVSERIKNFFEDQNA